MTSSEKPFYTLINAAVVPPEPARCGTLGEAMEEARRRMQDRGDAYYVAEVRHKVTLEPATRELVGPEHRTAARRAYLDTPQPRLTDDEIAGQEITRARLHSRTKEEPVEGLLVDRQLPHVEGRVRGAPAKLVDEARQLYYVNDGPVESIDAVYDGEHQLRLWTEAARWQEMFTIAPSEVPANVYPPAGYFAPLPADGAFLLGAPPVGVVTADVTALENAEWWVAIAAPKVEHDEGYRAIDTHVWLSSDRRNVEKYLDKWTLDGHQSYSRSAILGPFTSASQATEQADQMRRELWDAANEPACEEEPFYAVVSGVNAGSITCQIERGSDAMTRTVAHICSLPQYRRHHKLSILGSFSTRQGAQQAGEDEVRRLIAVTERAVQ